MGTHWENHWGKMMDFQKDCYWGQSLVHHLASYWENHLEQS